MSETATAHNHAIDKNASLAVLVARKAAIIDPDRLAQSHDADRGILTKFSRISSFPDKKRERFDTQITADLAGFHDQHALMSLTMEDLGDPVTALEKVNKELDDLLKAEDPDLKLISEIIRTKKRIVRMMKDLIEHYMDKRVDAVFNENTAKKLETVIEKVLDLIQIECLNKDAVEKVSFYLVNERNINGETDDLTHIEHGITTNRMERSIFEADKKELGLFAEGEDIVYQEKPRRIYVKLKVKGQLLGIMEVNLKAEKSLKPSELEYLQIVLNRLTGETDQAMPDKRVEYITQVGDKILNTHGIDDDFKDGIAEFMEMACLASRGAYSAEIMMDVEGDDKIWLAYKFNDDGQMVEIEMDEAAKKEAKKRTSPEQGIDSKKAMARDIFDKNKKDAEGNPLVIGKIIFKTAIEDGAHELSDEDEHLQERCAKLLSDHIFRWREALKIRTEGVDPYIAHAMMSGEGIETKSNDKFTVLFTDIAGYTQISEILNQVCEELNDPNLERNALHRVVETFLKMSQTTGKRYGGMWDKPEGDKAMIVFGPPFIKLKNVEGYLKAIRGTETSEKDNVYVQFAEHQVGDSANCVYVCAKSTSKKRIHHQKGLSEYIEKAKEGARAFLLEKYPDIKAKDIDKLIDVEKGVGYVTDVNKLNDKDLKVFIRMPLPGSEEFDKRINGKWTAEDINARKSTEDDNLDPLGMTKKNRRRDYFALNALKAALMMRHNLPQVSNVFREELLKIAFKRYEITTELSADEENKLLKRLHAETRLQPTLSTTTATCSGDMDFLKLALEYAADWTVLGRAVNEGARLQGGDTMQMEIKVPFEQYKLVQSLIDNNEAVPMNETGEKETWDQFLISLGFDPKKTTVRFSEHYESYKNVNGLKPVFSVIITQNKDDEIKAGVELTKEELLKFDGQEFEITGPRETNGTTTRFPLRTITKDPADAVEFWATIPNDSLHLGRTRYVSPMLLRPRIDPAKPNKSLVIQSDFIGEVEWNPIGDIQDGKIKNLKQAMQKDGRKVIEQLSSVPMGCYKLKDATDVNETNTLLHLAKNIMIEKENQEYALEISANKDSIRSGERAGNIIKNRPQMLYDFQSFYETVRHDIGDNENVVFVTNLKFHVLTKEMAEELMQIHTREVVQKPAHEAPSTDQDATLLMDVGALSDPGPESAKEKPDDGSGTQT